MRPSGSGVAGTAVALRQVAVVVGVENDWYPIPGAASDARRFASLLVRKGLRTDDVHLFLSEESPGGPLWFDANGASLSEAEGQGAPGAQILEAKPADRFHVLECLTRELPGTKADVLYFYWSGHGTIDKQDRSPRHRLIFGDATDWDARNLNLESLLELLRSRYFEPHIPRQYVFVDACADRYDFRRPHWIPGCGLPRRHPPKGEVIQEALFAAEVGKRARQIDFVEEIPEGMEGGFMTHHLLAALESLGLPPDVDRLTDEMRTSMEDALVPGLYRAPIEWVRLAPTEGRLELKFKSIRPAPPTQDFVGRRAEKERISRAIRERPTDRLTILVLRGLTGMGKSELALASFEEFRTKFRDQYWIPAGYEKRVEQGHMAIAVDLPWVNPPYPDDLRLLDEARRHLANPDSNYALFLDGANNLTALERFVGSEVVATGRGLIVVTTQDYEDPPAPWYGANLVRFDVHGLATEDLAEYVRRRFALAERTFPDELLPLWLQACESLGQAAP